MRNKNSDAARRRTKLELLHPQMHAVPPAAVAKKHKGSKDQLELIRCKSLTANRLRQDRQKQKKKNLCMLCSYFFIA